MRPLCGGCADLRVRSPGAGVGRNGGGMMDAATALLRVWAVAALALVAACGGSSTYDQRVAATTALFDELQPLFNTGFTGQPGEMPSTGTAVFSGSAVALIDAGTTPADITDLTGDYDLVLLGTATLTADFGTGRITGQAGDFFGRQGREVGAYTGTVSFLRGEIGETVPRGDRRPNDVRFDYEGTLTGQGNRVGLSGAAEGKFKGTPIRGLIAEGAGTADLDGTQTPARFGVVARRE